MPDASFQDVGPGPLALLAHDADDLTVIASLAQDAVLPVSEIRYDARRRYLALLLNRFRWEDAEAARREHRRYERVRSLLMISDVTRVQSDGIAQDEGDLVLELLGIGWQPGVDGTGQVTIQFAGDGTLVAEAECLNIALRDVTRPYYAASDREPRHGDA